MSPVKDVMGVRMRFDSDPPLPGEETPQEFRLKNLKDEVKRRRDHDRAIEARVTVVEQAVVEIKDEQRAGNRRTTLYVAALAVVSALLTAGLGYWGQLQAIKAGASQAKIGAAQAIQSATPSTESANRAGEEHGRQLEYERWKQWEADHPPPISRTLVVNGK